MSLVPPHHVYHRLAIPAVEVLFTEGSIFMLTAILEEGRKHVYYLFLKMTLFFYHRYYRVYCRCITLTIIQKQINLIILFSSALKVYSNYLKKNGAFPLLFKNQYPNLCHDYFIVFAPFPLIELN